MKIVDTLEETLNGGYGGLYGEVVTCDCYHIRRVQFQPDLVLDIGANVGVFSRFARSLFPSARIVAVEPHPENCAHFRKFTSDKNTHLLQAALGRGQIYHGTTHCNGSGATYLSAGLGYPKELLEKDHSLEHSLVLWYRFETLVEMFWTAGTKTICKIDCEGAENTIWDDSASLEALSKMDYIAMELHTYALHGGLVKEVEEMTNRGIAALAKTHNWNRNGVHFWASKKK